MYSLKELIVVTLMVVLVYGRPQFGGGPPEPSSNDMVTPGFSGPTTPFGNRRPSSSKPSISVSSSSVSSAPSVSGKSAVTIVVTLIKLNSIKNVWTESENEKYFSCII